ncbi:hypothetical protein BD410DRAFT_403384 [Rickenella mellea]|uniref:Uncharacterized protein n=1 Tax=Rickenella mellea TaxID=50990 RepID=A0A4Y7PYQ5_9AGAM|nr:hypothetical protein BD410DRAFT_403384 [Rickenella mellea]
MAQLKQYWALPFPTTIHVLLCTSTIFSLLAGVLSIAQISQAILLIIIFTPLTFLTLVHHGTVLFIVRRTTTLRETPKISDTLVRKGQLFALGFVLLCWAAGLAWAIGFTWFWESATSLTGVVFGLLEFVDLLALLVICIRDRRRFLRSGLNGKLSDVEANGVEYVKTIQKEASPLLDCAFRLRAKLSKRPKTENAVRIVTITNNQSQVEFGQRSDSDGSHKGHSPGYDSTISIGPRVIPRLDVNILRDNTAQSVWSASTE